MQVIDRILNSLVTKELERYEINFIIYFILHNISFQHIISINMINVKMISKIVYILFFVVSLWNLVNSVSQFSRSVVSDSLRPHEPQHAPPPCPSPTPGVHSNSRPSSRWCHPVMSSSVVPFFLLPPIPPSIRVFSNKSALRTRWPKYWSFSFNISPSNEHLGLTPLGWTGWISLQSKGLSRVFSNTTVKKHQFFGAQLSL